MDFFCRLDDFRHAWDAARKKSKLVQRKRKILAEAVGHRFLGWLQMETSVQDSNRFAHDSGAQCFSEYRVGDARITRLREIGLDQSTPAELFPEWRPDLIDGQRGWPFPGSWDAGRMHVHVSVHTWVVRTPRHTILSDTGAGNDKKRPFFPALDDLKEPYLERLQEIRVRPADVDFVPLTHIHPDHVGWNTRWTNGRWVPTFPNAKYVMSKREYQSFAWPGNRDHPRYCIFEDSVLPVVKSGQAEFVSRGGGEMVEGIQFLSTPGHSLDDMSICVRSKGEEALFGGDVLHHPPAGAVSASQFGLLRNGGSGARFAALDYAAARKPIYFSTHFPETSAGHITRRGEGFDWQYL